MLREGMQKKEWRERSAYDARRRFFRVKAGSAPCSRVASSTALYAVRKAALSPADTDPGAAAPAARGVDGPSGMSVACRFHSETPWR